MSNSDRAGVEAPLSNILKSRALHLFVAGGMAGAVSRTATAPIDRLKMILMVDNGTKRKSLIWGIRKMSSEGTYKSYFKGNGTNVLKIAPETAIKLTVSDRIKRFMVKDPENILFHQRFLCGAFAGATAQFTIYPMEVVRTRLAVTKPGTYHGLIHCARQVLRTEGIMSFYRGLAPTMVGIIPYAGVDISCFEILMKQLNMKYGERPPDVYIMGAGMCSATFAQFVSFPLSLIRIRLQAQGVNGMAVEYCGMADVLFKTIKSEGFFGLYKGILPNTLKVAPAGAISWVVFEKTKQLLGIH